MHSPKDLFTEQNRLLYQLESPCIGEKLICSTLYFVENLCDKAAAISHCKLITYKGNTQIPYSWKSTQMKYSINPALTPIRLEARVFVKFQKSMRKSMERSAIWRTKRKLLRERESI